MPNGYLAPPSLAAYGPGMATVSLPAQIFTMPYGAFHCPVCGYSGPVWHAGISPSLVPTYFGPGLGVWGAIGGLGGLRRHGGSYTPQFMGTGLPTDEEIAEMVYDTMDLDPNIPYDADIEVGVDAGVVTLTGTVPNKRVKHAAADDAWWVPGVVDVVNNLQVTRRRVKTAPGQE